LGSGAAAGVADAAGVVMSPTTIDRLRGLKPGEACRWYAGDLLSDIKNSSAIPAYVKLLTDLHREVLALKRGGDLVLSTAKTLRAVKPRCEGEKPQRVEVTEYFARAKS
jgi:hypothetical protein